VDMSDSEAVISKTTQVGRRRMTTLRLLPETFEKIDMLKRETGRSQREIIEMLIKMAKVGEYDKGD